MVPFGHLSAYQDDFFFYLTIARNLAERGVSTFDGVSLTNGYHPLWMGALILLAEIVPADSLAFVMLLQCLVFAASILAAWLFRALAMRAFPGFILAADVGTLLFTFGYVHLARSGMEVIAAVP